MKAKRFCIYPLLMSGIFYFAGCGGGENEDSGGASSTAGETESEPFKIVLQTDWYAQPEHGGFYQAMVEGYYAEEGLDVEIVPGGPNALTSQKVVQGVAQFSIGRSDDVIIAISRGLPLVIAGAFMQKDPQAIMFHQESGIESFKDLDGRSIMTTPGSAFIEVMERQHDIEVSVIPLDYGMSRFLSDKEFVQQCFITNEPYYVSREGANPETLLLADGGFRPYRVWYTSKSFLRRHPEIVAAFSRATIRGWREYLFGDRSKADAVIKEANPKMDGDFVEFSVNTMREENLITGESGRHDRIGEVDPERIEKQIQQLEAIGILDQVPEVEKVVTENWLKEEDSGEVSLDELSPLPLLEGGEVVKEWAYSDLLALPLTTARVDLELSTDPEYVEGILLKEILPELDSQFEWDKLLADCSDGYQSNYSKQVIRENKPLLILKINGQPTEQWVRSRGQPQWGPYMIQILEEGDLLDPVNKNPWGVEELALANTGSLAPYFVAGESFEEAHPGLKIYLSNCASCHRIGETEWGGALSTRPMGILASFAKNTPDYFMNMLADPVGTNPTASKMPAVEHYSPETKEKLRLYLAEVPH